MQFTSLALTVLLLPAPQVMPSADATTALNAAIKLAEDGEYERALPALNACLEQFRKVLFGERDNTQARNALTGLRRAFLYRGYALVGLGRENEARQSFANTFVFEKFEGSEADVSGDRKVLQSPIFGPKVKLLFESSIELAKAGGAFPSVCRTEAPAVMFSSKKERGNFCANYQGSGESAAIDIPAVHRHTGITFCSGVLSLSSSRIAYRPQEAKHTKDGFDIARTELKKEAGKKRWRLGTVFSVETEKRSYQFLHYLNPAFDDFVDKAFTDFPAAEKFIQEALKPAS